MSEISHGELFWWCFVDAKANGITLSELREIVEDDEGGGGGGEAHGGIIKNQ